MRASRRSLCVSRCHKQINLPIVDLMSNENESEEVTTSVDTGALDTATDELVAKNSGADSETPQHDPEPEPEDQGGEQEQLQLPGKVVDKLSPGATTSTRVDTPRVTEGKLILTLFKPIEFSIKLHTIIKT